METKDYHDLLELNCEEKAACLASRLRDLQSDAKDAGFGMLVNLIGSAIHEAELLSGEVCTYRRQ